MEDAAIEALEELVEKVRDLRSVEELKPLVGAVRPGHYGRAAGEVRVTGRSRKGVFETIIPGDKDLATAPKPSSSNTPGADGLVKRQ